MNILKKIFEVIKTIVLFCLAVIVGVPACAFALVLIIIYFVFILAIYVLFFIAQVITDILSDDF